MSEYFGTLLGYVSDVLTQDDVKEDNMKDKEQTFIHASGRYDRSPESVTRAVKSYYAKNPRAVSFTEYQDQPRRHALRHEGRFLVRGQGHAGLRELAISVAEKPRDTIVKEVTQATYQRVGGAIAPPKGIVIVQFDDGFVYATMHLANTVGNRRFDGPIRRIESFKSAVRNSARMLGRYDKVILGADFNVLLGLPGEMRAFLDSVYKEVGMTRARGTNGLDGFYTKGVKVTECRPLARNGSSDHTPVILKVKP